MTKVVVLNQGTINFAYYTIDALARTTWSQIHHPDVEVYHYYGGYDQQDNPIEMLGKVPARGEAYINKAPMNNVLVVGANDMLTKYDTYSIDSRGEKLILAYEWCVNNLEFDYIVRVCNTTYLDIKKMHRFLDSLERKERQYDGARNMYNYQYYFCGGMCNYMSRDCAEQLVEHKEEYLSLPRELNPEDLAVGVILMDRLKYAYWDEPCPNIHNFAYEPTFDPNTYDTTGNVFAYRFRLETVEKYMQFHQTVLRSYV